MSARYKRHTGGEAQKGSLRAKAEVVAFLINEGGQHTTRAIADRIGRATRNTRKALEALEREGRVFRRGKRILFWSRVVA